MTLRVAVLGAGGRMGQTVAQAVSGDEELELIGGVDPQHVGKLPVDIPGGAIQVDVVATPAELSPVDVVVDFTQIEAAKQNLSWAASAGVHAVVGTSGFTEADYRDLNEMFTTSNCIIAPNFAIGAVLTMRFAELAAPWFPTAEVIELHHDGKRDAPSGTAARTVERMAAASSDWGTDPTQSETIPGARGATGPGGIHVHAVRLRGLVAHQEVLLGTTGETLTIRHDSYDRASFMPGVLLAAKRISTLPGVTVGLDTLLGI